MVADVLRLRELVTRQLAATVAAIAQLEGQVARMEVRPAPVALRDCALLGACLHDLEAQRALQERVLAVLDGVLRDRLS